MPALSKLVVLLQIPVLPKNVSWLLHLHLELHITHNHTLLLWLNGQEDPIETSLPLLLVAAALSAGNIMKPMLQHYEADAATL